MPMIGNLPWASSDGCDPDALDRAGELQPASALEAGDARREGRATKSPGLVSMSAHWMPIESILIGRNDGHLKLSPVRRADARGRRRSRCLALNVPLPRKAKLRALAGELERADLDLRADRAERDELLVGGRAGVEQEVARGQRDEGAEL